MCVRGTVHSTREHKQTTDWTDPTFPVVEGDFPRQVTAATANDDGTVTLVLLCTPSDITFPYASWDPEEESKNLVTWIHGAGEGGTEGTDPIVTVLGNKVTALAGDGFQETIGGAHVVAPQCPTMWMDMDGTATYIEMYDADGNPGD